MDWLPEQKTREAHFAGQFYPGLRDKLIKQLNGLFSEVETVNPEKALAQNLQALIVPHAGYVYSGKVAAAAFAQIPEKSTFKHVFVLASSHRFSFAGASVYCTGNYRTPLGEVKVATRLARDLINSSELIIEHDDSHEYEHSLEVQLPFLQHKLGDNFSLVPIIIGTHDIEICQRLATILKPWFTKDNLWVISTDFSHYPEYDDACKVDDLTATAICSNRPDKLQKVLNENKKLNIRNLATSLCGWTSVLTLLNITGAGDFSFEKIKYQNSGDTGYYGGKNKVVGYWAIAIYRRNQIFDISSGEKKELLENARTAIIKFLKTGETGNAIPPVSNGILNSNFGAFVSVYINGKLRGCIGSFAHEKSLNDLVQRIAVSAACDLRFREITPNEIEDMELEISVLSPLKKIDSIKEIELGRHGIYIKQGPNTGTFLPQVALKTNWTPDEFLGRCSRDKAGIGWDGWKTAEIYIYEAMVIK